MDEVTDLQTRKVKFQKFYKQIYEGTPVQIGINSGQVFNFVQEI